MPREACKRSKRHMHAIDDAFEGNYLLGNLHLLLAYSQEK